MAFRPDVDPLPASCLQCRTFLDGYERVGDEKMANRVMLCMHCGQLHNVDSQGHLRLPTKAQLNIYLRDERVIAAFAAIYTINDPREAAACARRLIKAREN